MPCADLMTVDLFNARMNAIEENITFALNSHSATIDELRNEISAQREKIDRIYKILDGDIWFEADGANASISIDPDLLMRSHFAQEFDHNEDGTEYTSKEMTCTSLSSLISAIVASVYLRLGLDDFPQRVPENVTKDFGFGWLGEQIGETFLDEQIALSHINIPTMTQFNRWQFKQIDALFGRFPVKIEIEDNDLIQTGSQSAKIKLPNLAETLAEITGKILQNDAKINAILNVIMRILQEVATNKLTDIKTHYMVDAIVEYLNFKEKKTTIEVPFTFDLTKLVEESADGELQQLNAKLSEFLQTKNYKVEVDEYDDDQTLEEELRIIIEGARIIKSVFYEKVNGSDAESLKADLLKQFTDLGVNLFDSEETPEATGEPNSQSFKTPRTRRQEDFDNYLENVEQGFIKEAQGSDLDSTKPFGKPWDRRPRIREIGNQGDLT
jgi:hypothetical protein